MRRRTRRSPALWREVLLDGAVLVGLAGLAVTQPLLDLFGRNPTFFVAGGYGRRHIVLFAVVLAVGPALAMWGATTVPGLVHRSVRAVLHSLGVATLGGLFGLVLARSFGVDGLMSALGVAGFVGVGIAAAEGRWRPVRHFLGYLALGNVAFLAFFLFGSPSSELLQGNAYADAGNVMVPAVEGPVTVIILDEFPLTAIVRPDGTINDVRYPNLAALAEESNWFRNASAESQFTAYSVPSIMTGLLSEHGDLPILSDFPRNYFTLFGQSYPVQRYEAITDLCPPDACGRPPAEPFGQAFDDARLVYQHRVLPERWRQALPPVDEAWGNFGEASADAADVVASSSVSSGSPPDPNARLSEIPVADQGRGGQVNALLRQVRTIDSRPSINLVHVLAPHVPYVLTPWGTTGISTISTRELPQPGAPGSERIFAERYALQAMQVGAVDHAIGEVIQHLKQVGAWESGTFVLLSDHGTTTLVPGNGRSYSEETKDELLRIPLFIKAPGQTQGETRDEPASTIDVLPSLIDLLGIETDWELDGHSLFDGSEPKVDRRLTSELDDLFTAAEHQQSYLPYGEDWVAMAAIGPYGGLVGTPVSGYEVGEPSAMSWSLDDRPSLDDPSLTGGAVPVLMTGTVHATTNEPPDLIVALDGTIAGTIGAQDRAGDGWAFSGILGPPGARGRGEQVVAYEVERVGGEVVLHPVSAA
jgi:hypothetical protein